MLRDCGRCGGGTMDHERYADEHDAAIVMSEDCWEWRAFACSLAFAVVLGGDGGDRGWCSKMGMRAKSGWLMRRASLAAEW